MLNRVGDQTGAAPVTLPRITFKTSPDDDRRDQVQHFLEMRTIKAGIDAWSAIDNAGSFEAWKKIGTALAIGKQHALHVTGANAAWGRNYSAAFSEWFKQHGFERMPASTRSVAIELHENLAAIETWRASLTDGARRRCVHPLTNVRRWLAATADKAKHTDDLVKAATVAWRRFVACVEVLPPDQAAPFLARGKGGLCL